MRPTDRISIASVDESSGTSKLTLNGALVRGARGRDFDGSCIEAQYECEASRYLLCLSYGTGWDDALNFYLFAHDGSLLDAMTGGGLMSIGVYRFLGCRERTLDFSFFSDDRISRLTVSPQPSLRLLLPQPWRYRRLLARHYLSLREVDAGGEHD
jgi:hypothetical protein